ncbi:hypothetical protein V7S57_02605 [Caulobacter sp. CCNWLY153]|uniref:hypothetical protein n=1 Tax=unclassified Caulobacter TaxID=2648921 RepID=UPI002FF1DC1D
MTDSAAPDAIILGRANDDFWRAHPAVAKVETTKEEDAFQTSLWLHAPETIVGAPVVNQGVNVPTRDPDWRFENDGHAPPAWFWATHPAIAAWTIEHDDGFGSMWWIEVWLRDA